MQKRPGLCLQKTAVLIAVYLVLRFILPLILPFFLAWVTVHALAWIGRRIRLRLFPLSILYLLVLTGLVLLAASCACALLYEPCRELLPICQNYWSLCSSYLDWLPQSLSGEMMSRMPDLCSSAFSIFLYYISVLLFARDWHHIRQIFQTVPFFTPLSRAAWRIASLAGGWVKAQSRIMLVVAAECVLGYYLLHIPHALVWAILTGLVDALPVFSTGVVFFPWLLILLLQQDFAMAGWIGLLFLVTWLTRELLEPRLLGQGLGLLPIGFLLSVVVGLQLFGAIGLFAGPFGILFIKELWVELERSAPPETPSAPQ